MTFGEVLWDVLSFFWSPLTVFLVLLVFTVGFLIGLVDSISDAGVGAGELFFLGVATFIFGVLSVTMVRFMIENAMDPLSWQH